MFGDDEHVDSSALPKPDPLKDSESWELLEHNLGWVDEGGNKDKKTKGSKELKEAGESRAEKEDDAGTSRSGEQKSEPDVGDDIHEGQKIKTEYAESFRLGPNMFGDDGPKVKILGKEMVKHCNGIPLAIVVLGGILRKKETLAGWRLVSENITSYLRRGNDHGKSYMEVLVLSYSDLPYHLKPCFLHIGNFPEDYEIQAEKLYRMWVAEGLVTWPYDRVSSTESLEDIANEYLSHLAQAGMVQIMNKASNGRIKSVRIHDLMRDVCLQKAATENFFSMIDHRTDPDEPQSLSSSSNHARLLHMAIYLAEDVKNYLPDFLTSKAHMYLKSLLFFAGQEVREELVQQWMKHICNDFPWLRVLDIEGLRLKGRLTKNVQKMKHLRYLSLKETYISELPSSISNLMFLQTLDLRVSFSGSPVKIPNTLWKLERLRHLFLPKKSYEIKKSRFLFLHTLSCLETLKNLEIGVLRAEDLQKLRKLKKLSIKDAVCDVKIMKSIVKSPAVKSGHLRNCSLCVEGSVIDADPGILSTFDCLDELKVVEKISHPKECILPRSLVVLQMESCELEDDPMIMLGNLRHLKHLSLGVNSFIGKKMICKRRSFPQLVTLNLQGLTNLEDWILEKESISELKKVSIMDCAKLKRIPDALPRSVQVTCSPCISGIENHDTCNYYGATCSVVDYDKVFIERDDDTSKLVKLLLDDQSKKVVVSGPSGIGKATLAKRLYSKQEIKEKFGAIAWVRCPNRRIPKSPIRLINGILRQLDPGESTRSSRDSSERSDLLNNVMERKKCLVILTGLAAASLEDLDAIFGTRIPVGSKVLFTNDRSYPKDPNKLVQLNLKPLSEGKSLGLFMTILGDALSGTEGGDKLELGNRLLIKLCSGQPHSIIMLAGLLAMKKYLKEWQNIEAKVIKQGEGSQPNLYALCYEDLAPHLKDCFLYLANFPENTEISTRKLYNLWIAAGLIRLKDDGKKRKESVGEVGKPMENVAASYLNKLVQRGMVQVGKRGLDGRICTCHLQITLRSFCVEKADEKGFHQAEWSASVSDGRGATARIWKCGLQVPLQSLCLGKQREEHVPPVDQSRPSAQASKEIEHLAVYLKQSGMKIPYEPAPTHDPLKSLLFFPEISTAGDDNWQQCFRKFFNHFRLLRILDLEGMQMIKGALPAEVGYLIHLRYFSLKGTHVRNLPSEIKQLTHLQTLDLRVAVSLTIPSDSFTFPHLRHLFLPESFSVSMSPKLQLGGLDHLQTLANLHTGNVNLDCVSDLKNLSRIFINDIQAVNELDEKLKSKGATIDLSIRSKILDSNAMILSSFQYLNKVTIKGRISGFLRDGMFPTCLTDLTLKHTALDRDPIPALEQLPGLKYLCFDHDSFLGKKMTISLGFFRLTHLTLRLLSNLEELDMTEARHLLLIEPLIIDCWRLEVKLPNRWRVKYR